MPLLNANTVSVTPINLIEIINIKKIDVKTKIIQIEIAKFMKINMKKNLIKIKSINS